MASSLTFGALAAFSIALIVWEHRATRAAQAAKTAKAKPRDPYHDPHTLGLRILREDLFYLLEHYRPLDHDYPDRVKYPRLSDSWPNFDENLGLRKRPPLFIERDDGLDHSEGPKRLGREGVARKRVSTFHLRRHSEHPCRPSRMHRLVAEAGRESCAIMGV